MATTETAAQAAQTNGAAPSAERASNPSQRITSELLEQLAARVATAGKRELQDVDQPFTGELLGRVPRCTEEDVEVAFERAREAQREWRKTSYAQRKRVLLRYHDLILDRQEEALDLLQLDTGKARRHGF